MKKRVLSLVALAFGLAQTPQVELVGFAALPADTFAEGPASGAYRENPGFRAARAPFASQPVQGFSAIQFGPQPGSYWVLSDNGFGSKANSPDYLLRLYLVTPQPRTAQGGPATVQVNRFVQFRDPNRLVPFPILNENTPERLLTGFDFDPESFVIAADGSIWVGDEFGPYLLHFDANGVLLDPPFATPDFGAGKDPSKDFVRAPQNPALVMNPVAPGQPSPANLPTSRGYEGMTTNPARNRIYAMLEGTVSGDPAGTVRLMEFDPQAKRWVGLLGRYLFDDPSHAIGELAVINDNEYLVIERDSRQGAEARFKRIYKIDLTRRDANGVFVKELVADLLNIADPRGLAPSTQGGVFRFPYFTIEAVLVLDPNTLLVTNDNNYPATGGRGAEIKDANEFIWLRLPAPLRPAPGVGQSR
ncbi:MAG: esterase-like activity of phytase family protein [Meiothermus sp.]|uniref:esterase-like activity of phytase family protein n=1 Tax=Meiothermus sp. TaxID=1955249 RepID=UPI0025D4E803|nr:esterase-like activity of phytase family protein [Meiothermus sp.]MCS7069371.1 esterase-like activity of phytase family protein [Meiothermus sp.]MDW8426537.1 esterase-like activity of phytase family protein [Meiothermus sp.]